MITYFLLKRLLIPLIAVGSPIDTAEHIEIVLDGLPNEYDPIVTAIISPTNAYSIPEIEFLLLNIEGRIEKQRTNSSDAFAKVIQTELRPMILIKQDSTIAIIEVLFEAEADLAPSEDEAMVVEAQTSLNAKYEVSMGI